jgi:hypothetical protein
MNLTGSTVSFHLSPQGREALKGIVPEREFLEGFVVDENHMGVWLLLPEFQPATKALLLKWEHFSTATLEYEPQGPVAQSPVGFRH